MGVLSKILKRPESIATVEISDQEKLVMRRYGFAPTGTTAAPATREPETGPPPETCILCDSAILYATIYDRKNFRCPICEPPPADRLVATWLVDGKPLAEVAAEARGESAADDNLADLAQTDPYWRAPNPWLEKTFERYEELQVDGWDTLVLKREFRR